MAKERLWLRHKESGEKVFLGKNAGAGWYRPSNIGVDRLNDFFDKLDGFESSYEPEVGHFELVGD